jgi:hypothetical protein
VTTSVAFLALGGPHQVLHLAPVAAALSQESPAIEVALLAADDRSLALARRAVAFYPREKVRFERLYPPKLYRLLGQLGRQPALSKLLVLWRNRRELARFDAIVVAECTSTALRRMGVRRPGLLCVPHGAGDRAVSFEPRFALFDRLFVAGRKTAERLVESGVAADRVEITGYPKADLVRRMTRERARFFDDARPVILYSPHFRTGLSSLGAARQIVAALAADPGFNLIFAPHVRAFEGASRRTIAAWGALAVPGKVMIDLGSDRSVDMSYTAAADIYVGDVSSQVYEFLLRPRPCVFVNAHGVRWEDDPDYAFWHLGEVAAPDAIPNAVARATDRHADFLPLQHAAVDDTFAAISDPALATAQAIRRTLGQ